jgi:Spy/CpxP family protein refolding chaperone
MDRSCLKVAVAALAIGTATAVNAVPLFSATERAEGLRAGLGMGLAKSADDNGYPGPRHVLDMADKLVLSAEQRSRIAVTVAKMTAEAIPAAESTLKAEAALERLFVSKTATLQNIDEAAQLAGRRQVALQVIHLKYHLQVREILTPGQIAAYDALSGRTGAPGQNGTGPGQRPAAHVHDMTTGHQR